MLLRCTTWRKTAGIQSKRPSSNRDSPQWTFFESFCSLPAELLNTDGENGEISDAQFNRRSRITLFVFGDSSLFAIATRSRSSSKYFDGSFCSFRFNFLQLAAGLRHSDAVIGRFFSRSSERSLRSLKVSLRNQKVGLFEDLRQNSISPQPGSRTSAAFEKHMLSKPLNRRSLDSTTRVAVRLEKDWQPIRDNPRNFLVTPTAEMLCFFQQLREAFS